MILAAIPFKLIIDATAYEYLLKADEKTTQPRTLKRYHAFALRLQEYLFEVCTVKSENNIADPLSRLIGQTRLKIKTNVDQNLFKSENTKQSEQADTVIRWLIRKLSSH